MGLTMVWRVAIAPGFWPGPVAPLAFAYGAVANRAPLARMGPVCPWPGRCPVAIAPVGLGRALGHIRGRAGPLAGCPGCQPCPRALARAVALGPLAPGRLPPLPLRMGRVWPGPWLARWALGRWPPWPCRARARLPPAPLALAGLRPVPLPCRAVGPPWPVVVPGWLVGRVAGRAGCGWPRLPIVRGPV